jgi:hypothetical protein
MNAESKAKVTMAPELCSTVSIQPDYLRRNIGIWHQTPDADIRTPGRIIPSVSDSDHSQHSSTNEEENNKLCRKTRAPLRVKVGEDYPSDSDHFSPTFVTNEELFTNFIEKAMYRALLRVESWECYLSVFANYPFRTLPIFLFIYMFIWSRRQKDTILYFRWLHDRGDTGSLNKRLHDRTGPWQGQYQKALYFPQDQQSGD